MIELKHGQALVIVGPQGSGKSTLAIDVAKKYGTYETRTMQEVLSDKSRYKFFDQKPDTVIVDEAIFNKESLDGFRKAIQAKDAPFYILEHNSHDYPSELTNSRQFNLVDVTSIDLYRRTALIGTTINEKQTTIQLGQLARDKITGFEGVIISRVTYLTGCDQYGLCPKARNGEVKVTEYFDEGRIMVLENDPIVPSVSSSKPGGTNRDHPR